MKKTFLFLIANILVFGLFSQEAFKARLITGDEGYIYFQLQQTQGSTNPDALHLIGNITIGISWPNTLANVDAMLLCTPNEYYIEQEGAGKRTDAGNSLYYRKDANYTSNSFAPPIDWVNGTWNTIAKFKITDPGSGNGDFSIYTLDGFNFSYDADGDNSVDQDENYFPSLESGQSTVSAYPYPTLIYDYVWKADGQYAAYYKYWDGGTNWEDECGTERSTPPNTGNNCFIPVLLSGDYPEFVYNIGGMGAHQPLCDYLTIAAGASLAIDDIDDNSNALLYTVNNDLINNGTLTIVPDAKLTVTGDTYIDAAEGIVIQADANGVGSFINNGTISYDPSSGTAKVQTYLSNSAGTGNFDIHNIGPTVDEANYTGSGTGAFLSAFNFLPGDTWAYNWDETANIANGWVNIISLTDVILSAEGIGLSTSDNIPHILEMTGEFITGNVTNALTHNNNHYELISNPYPSSVDFDALATANSVVYNKYWIYNPAANNYVTRTVSSAGPGPQYVQVGQGMFVETISAAGMFTFTNTERAHSNDPFRSIISNKLTVVATGGQVGYKDEMVIRFDADATSGYDANIEAIKWNSLNADATMIRSITEEGTELAINVLPYVSLKSGITSVPMHFNCGYNTEYTISFLTMETFEQGTEIWLEDKQTGAEWINIFINPEYTFAASPNDPANRFVIHFFGPTSVDEHGVQNAIDIYGYRQFAYVRNNTTELIKDVQIYSLAGELLHRHKTVDTKLNKYWVSDKIGYYLVRVITNKNVYSGKVLITK